MKKYAEHISVNTVRANFLLGAIHLRRPLVGEGGGVINLKLFGEGGRGEFL